MTSPFNDAGHEDLRKYLTSNWTQLALVRDDGVIETVLDIPSDSRVSWSDPATNPVEATATITGGSGGVSGPVTLQGTALFDSVATVAAGDGLSATTPYHDEKFQAGDLVIDSGQTIDIAHQLQQPTQ